MEPIASAPSASPSDASPPSFGELIVHNGRLSGTRRSLDLPVTLVGRAPGCDVRLNAEGVSPQHCLLGCTPSGLVVRDLNSDGGTRVNGDRVLTCTLRDGDVLAVGPFQFQVRLHGLPETEEQRREREALRIQAAAAAAQQAALTEEEIKLRQRQVALEQQEEQLAAHLEEKRQRLDQLREEARSAHQALRHDRAVYEQRVDRVTREVAGSRRELQDAQRQTLAERQRLIGLRRYLKHRWHRHWMAERRVMRRREEELAGAYRRLEKDNERLRQDRAAQVQARLRHNGEVELGRRQLQAKWDEYRREQQQWQERRAREQEELRERAHSLERQAQALADAEDALAEERDYWQTHRLALETESDGLETRVRNYRRKILDQEREAVRLETILGELQRRVAAAGTAAGGAPAEPALAVPAPAPLPPAVEWAQREGQLREAEGQLQERVTALQKLTGELADQRLYLAEQWERLFQTQHLWQQDHNAAAAELEVVAVRLQAREEAVTAREQALEPTEDHLRRQREEIAHQRQHLNGWQARLHGREAAWEGERDRLLADLRTREELVEQRLADLGELRQRWESRRAQEMGELQTERAACEKLRQEFAALREEWLRRQTAVEQEQRSVAEKALVLEQYRQEFLGQAANSAAAARRLERLRRRWTAQNAAALKALARERQAFRAESTQWETRCRQVHKHGEEVAAWQEKLSSRQTVWEHNQMLTQGQQARLRQELESLRARRARYEQQLNELRDEVERVARFLLEEVETTPVSAVQAA